MDRIVEEELRFLMRADRLKQVLRHNRIGDDARRENAAEHSWHLALMAIVLARHAAEPCDLGRVLALVAVHDLIEIAAGDTFAYDDAALAGKAERETEAAAALFAPLDEPQRDDLAALWREFEAGATPEARFARALDRLQPLLLHEMTGGRVWRERGVRASQVRARVSEIRSILPSVWPFVEGLLERAVEAGQLAGD